jgi:hypothetical protein
MDDASRARAASRRQNWTGVAHGFEEMEEADLKFWMAATPAERVRGVTMLIDEMRSIRGEHGPSPRLQRSIGGVRPRAVGRDQDLIDAKLLERVRDKR